jgi:hypothetical protein
MAAAKIDAMKSLNDELTAFHSDAPIVTDYDFSRRASRRVIDASQMGNCDSDYAIVSGLQCLGVLNGAASLRLRLC